MDLAYGAADIIISRAGAISVSELCIVGKPVIFIPSPNVAEDHQTKNAKSLVDKKAAIHVNDVDSHTKLVELALELVDNERFCKELSTNIKKLAKPNAAKEIVLEPKSLCFTYCQIPIIYKLASESGINVVFNEGPNVLFDSLSLDVECSNQMFSRTGEIEKIIVSINRN